VGVIYVYIVQAATRKKLLRSLAGLGGVSDRTLSLQLEWIRENPEVRAHYV
jgi:hypothetical protein